MDIKKLNVLNDLLYKLYKIDKRDPNENSIFIAGGAVVSALSDTSIRDIDVYCTSNEVILDLKDGLKEKGKMLYKTKNVTCYDISGDYPIEVINHKVESIEKLLQSFDFYICRMALSIKELVIHESEAYSDIKKKRIRMPENSISDLINLNTIGRIQKYIKKGYTIEPSHLYSILELIGDKVLDIGLDEDDPYAEEESGLPLPSV